ncbi:MAG TPA: M48 family metalloprotease [Candidatus Limnocylindrales bacterium]
MAQPDQVTTPLRVAAPADASDTVPQAMVMPPHPAPPVIAQENPPVPGWPKPPAPPPQRRPKSVLGPRLFARPPGFPNAGSWLVTGMFRDWRGLLGAILVSVFNIPLAFLFGGIGAVLGGLSGFLGIFVSAVDPGATGGPGFETLQDFPIVGTAMQTFLFKAGGPVGLFVGIVLGGLGGFLFGLLLPWFVAADDPGVAIGLFLGQLFGAFFLGLLYTIYRVAAEGATLRIAGVRQPSRRESELLLPLLRESAERLRLNGYPRLLIDDSREPNAYCGARHIIVNRGLLDEFNYDPEPLSAVLAHELTHWRNADSISSFFIRGMVLPYYLLYIAVTWAIERFRHPVIQFFLWAIAWPLMMTIRYVIMPLQGMGSREAEFAADHGAVEAGHRVGLRRALSRFRTSFDGARNGWDLSVCATHPPNELRLERIEEPGVNYPLPDPDAPARPLPVVVSSGVYKD